jgi:hypothetical protein
MPVFTVIFGVSIDMNRFSTIGAVIILSLGLAACSKVHGPANGNSIQANNHQDSLVFMSAIVNGLDWRTDSAFGYSIRNSANDSTVFTLEVTATQMKNGQASTIQFDIPRFTGPSTYNINPPLITASYYEGTTRNYATSGTITVTDTSYFSLIGNFNFSTGTVNVTGQFNVAKP